MSILNRQEAAGAAARMGEIYGALSLAQGEFPEIAKTKKGHGYMYADIADILRAVRPILASNGLAVMQMMEDDVLVTSLVHKSGAKIDSRYPLVVDGTGRMNNIQRQGAALTYARRYSLTALLGVAADEDVDASDVDLTPRNPSNPSGGLKDAWQAGVLDALAENATDRERAEAFANQIIVDIGSKKSADGVNGVWGKRSAIIEALDKKHNDLYQSIFDAFHEAMGAFVDDA